jgi:integrase
MKHRMSPAWVDSLKPGPKPIEYRDSEGRGLILHVEASGRKTWAVRYMFGAKRRRFTIGAYPDVKLSAARAKAEEIRGGAQLGTDALENRQAERDRLRIGETVADIVRAWLQSAESRAWRPRSRASFLSHVNVRILPRLGPLKLTEVGRAHVLGMLDQVKGGVTRNRLLTVTRLLFRWAVGRGLIATDPATGIGKLPEDPRERVLSDEELRAFVGAFDATRWGNFLRLLLLTGVRRDELLGARWVDVDRDQAVWTIPPEAEKSGRRRRHAGARKVALSAAALEVLARQRQQNMARGLGRAPWAFPTSEGNRPHRDAVKPTLNMLRGRRPNGTTSRHKLAKKREAVIPRDANLHDLRRTVADRMLNALSVSAYVVDVGVLGHVKPALLGVYAPSAPLKDTRAALALWSEELARVLREEPKIRTRTGADAE